MPFLLDGADNILSRCWIARTGSIYTTIPNAMAAVSADDHVILSPGEFAGFTVSQNNLTIVGDGRDSSIINDRVIINGKTGLRFSNLGLNGSANIGFDISNNSEVRFEDVLISDCGTSGLLVNGSTVVARRIIITRCAFGVTLFGADDKVLDISDSVITYNTDTGLKLGTVGTTQAVYVNGNAIYGNTNYDADSVTVSLALLYNWWGTPSPDAGQFNNIIYSPELTYPELDVYGLEASAGAQWYPTEQGIATLPVPGQAFISTTGGISDSDDAVELDRIDNFPDAGYIQFVSGEVAYYDGITGRTLQNLERGAFGTTPAAQAEDSQVLYVIPRPLIISLINGANQPVAPDSAPKVQIIDNHGDDILAEEDMTLVSTGVYQSWVMLNPLMEPDVWRVKFTTVVGGNTAIIWQNLTINKPTASVNLNMFEGDFQVDENGYRDSSGTFTEWGDAKQGPVTQQGSPIGGLQVTAFNVVNNARIYSNNPPGVSFTNQLGKWDMKLYAGTYDFLFTKKNFTTVTVRRTIA